MQSSIKIGELLPCVFDEGKFIKKKWRRTSKIHYQIHQTGNLSYSKCYFWRKNLFFLDTFKLQTGKIYTINLSIQIHILSLNSHLISFICLLINCLIEIYFLFPLPSLSIPSEFMNRNKENFFVHFFFAVPTEWSVVFLYIKFLIKM